MKQYRTLILVALVFTAALIAILYKLYEKPLDNNLVAGAGRLDGDLVLLNAKYPGRILNLYVQEGDHVEANTTVARLDAAEIDAKIEAAKAALAMAESGLESDKTALSVARTGLENQYSISVNQVVAADAQMQALDAQIGQLGLVIEQDRKDTERLQRLFEQHLIEAHRVELSKLKLESDQKSLEVLKRQALQAQKGSASAKDQSASAKAETLKVRMYEAKIKASEAQIEAAKANLKELATIRSEYTIKAPRAGDIIDTVAHEGEMVGPGSAVVSMVDRNSLYMKMYVDTVENARIKIGDKASIFLDGQEDKAIEARVVRISPQAEFSPKEVNVKNDRIQRMYAVHLKALNPPASFKLGLPCVAIIATDGATPPSTSERIKDL